MDSPTNMFGVPPRPTASSLSGTRPPNRNTAGNPAQFTAPVTPTRSLTKRIFLVLISIILFLAGLFFLYVAYISFQEYGVIDTTIPGTLGLILAGGGVLIGISGIKSRAT